MLPEPTRLGLIRHAPTLWNETKRIQGTNDSALSARGRKMAALWGRQLSALSWDRMLGSDIGRARETVQLIRLSLHLPVTFDLQLIEQDWGDWTGLQLAQLRADFPELVRTQEARGWNFCPPGGESRVDLLARCRSALLQAHASWPGENILVVCHEGVIKCLLYDLLGRQFLPEEPSVIRPYHLHLFEVLDGVIRLEQINHLPLLCRDEGGKGS